MGSGRDRFAGAFSCLLAASTAGCARFDGPDVVLTRVDAQTAYFECVISTAWQVTPASGSAEALARAAAQFCDGQDAAYLEKFRSHLGPRAVEDAVARMRGMAIIGAARLLREDKSKGTG